MSGPSIAMALLMNVFKYLFQACLYCQSHFCLEDSIICEECGEQWQRKPMVTNQHRQFSSRSLLVWGKENPSVGSLVKKLKGADVRFKKSQHEFMAKRFWSEFYATERYSRQPLVFIPAPPRNENEDDHASLFAKELARLFNSPCEKWLKRTHQNEQKGMSYEERALNKLELREDIDLDKSRGTAGKIIFVDDVLVSGQTARAAYIALDKPTNFEVWTIAYRPLFLAPPLAKTSRT